MNANSGFRIECRPVGSLPDEKQIFTFSADDPATATARACFQRYTWHYDLALSFLYQNTTPLYYNYLLTPELDGDVLVIYNLNEYGTSSDMIMALAAEADWFFLNGNMAVLTGPRGDQNAASSMIAELKTCIGLQA